MLVVLPGAGQFRGGVYGLSQFQVEQSALLAWNHRQRCTLSINAGIGLAGYMGGR
jgi:hypothetical protein